MRNLSYFIFVSVILLVSCRNVQTTKETFTVPITKESVTRGKELTMTMCGQCHLNPSTNTLIGVQLYDVPKSIGVVYSKNITESKEAGIGNYTDAQLFYLIKTGISKDGKVMMYMMRPNIADQDLNDIIAYLRSGDAPVAANDSVVGTTRYTFMGKQALKAVIKPQPYHTGIVAPKKSDQVAYGRYLIDNIGCYHCHSHSVPTLDFQHPENSKGYLAGGQKTQDASGNKFYSSNITPDKETGIGNYSIEEFRQAVRGGIGKGNKILRYPMKMYSDMTNVELDAIYAYLMTLKPVHNEVKKTD